ncbi:MAG TPA: DNA primase [Bacteroidales bacterium]|nr:DNA primase [Bacteroidales bacterium]
MISQATIESILNAASIEEVIGEYVNLRQRGANLVACCPFHNEKTPSFTVSPSKGIFKCFGCGKAGNVIRFIMEHEHLSYVEALKFLGNKYNIPVEDKEETTEEAQSRMLRDSMLVVNEYAREFYSRYLTEEQAGKDAGLSYLTERGFNEPIIRQFGLGYAPEERDAFTRAALAAGYKQELLVATGLTLHHPAGGGRPETFTDRFRDRVMFPIHSLSGRVIGFGGRTLQSSKQVAKYVNSPESEVYDKSRSLYGLYFAKQHISKLQKCYLVEGYTDVLSLFQAGIMNVVSSSGTSLTEEQIRLIKRFARQVTVLYDGDDAGIKASIRGITMILEEGLQVKVVRFPAGDDPDSYARSHSAQETLAFLEQHETDFIHFKISLMAEEMKDPLKRSSLIRDVVDTISVIPDIITRTVYIEECSRHLGIEELILTREVARIRRRRYSRQAPERPATPLEEQDHNLDQFSQNKRGDALAGKNDISRCEKDILYYLLKFGQSPLQEETSVAEYITLSLEEDELELQDPLMLHIFKEYMELTGDNQARRKYFTNHVNPEIARYALDLLNQPHSINLKVLRDSLPIEESLLKENVTKSVLVYKLRVVSLTCNQLTRELQQAQLQGEEGVMEEIMRKLTVMMEVRNSFAKELNRLS